MIAVNWPAFLVLLREETTATGKVFILLNCACLSLEIPFLIACLVLDNRMASNVRQSLFFLVSGVILLVVGFLTTAALLAPLIFDSKSKGNNTEALYVSTWSFLMNLPIGISIYRSLYNFSYSKVRQITSNNGEQYDETTLGVLARTLAHKILWSLVFVIFIWTFLDTFTNTLGGMKCTDITFYWMIVFMNFGLALVILSIIFYWNTNRVDVNRTIFEVLMFFYGVIFFPFNLFWFLKGIRFILDGRMMECNVDTKTVILNFLIYGWIILPGTLLSLTFIFSLIAWIFSAGLRHLCPQYFVFNLNQMRPIDVPLLEFEMIEIRAEKFEPTNYRESFTENEVCAICLEKYKEDQMVSKWMGCNHLFHHKCIQRWVRNKPNCPLCKLPYTQNALQVQQHQQAMRA